MNVAAAQAHLHRLFLGLLLSGSIALPAQVPGAAAAGQAVPNPISGPQAAVPLCDPAHIDGSFTFRTLAATAIQAEQQEVTLHFKNRGARECRLQGEAAPSFAVDGHSMHVGRCWLCRLDGTGSPVPQREPANEILLAADDGAALDLHWASKGEKCQRADWVDFFLEWGAKTGYLLLPANWHMNLCSAVTSTGYRRDAPSMSSLHFFQNLLRVTATPTTIYSDERAELHIELTEEAEKLVQPTGCPEIYTVRQQAGATQLDAVQVEDASSLVPLTPEQVQRGVTSSRPHVPKGYLSKCELAGAVTSADIAVPAEALAQISRVEWRASPMVGEPEFLNAPAHFTVLDPDTLPPNWGAPVRGIRAGLSVDKARFVAGEAIPLHLRWENVAAERPLARGECGEPLPSVEIRDAQQRVVQVVPVQSMCMGHGWGPFTTPANKPFREFVTLGGGDPLNSLGDRLPGPGVYYLTVVWTPFVLVPVPARQVTMGVGKFGKVYAQARSQPVRVEVLEKR